MSCVPCISRLISLELCVICAWFVRLFSGSDDKNQERARANMLINAWIPVDPCCTVASVRKRLQASGIERSRRSVYEYMAAEHWPAKQVIRG